MNSKRLHFILIGVLILLFGGLVGGAYGTNSLLVKQSTSLTALKAKSQALDQQKIGLIKAKKDIAKYSELEMIAKAIVPEDKSQAEAVREIVKIADANNISLASITFPASSLGSGPAGTASASTATVVVPSPVSSKKSLSQLLAVKNIPGVYQLQIVVNGDTNKPVPYDKFIAFLDDLEHNRRTAQVSSITLQPDQNNRNNLTFNLTLNEYIKP
jgi:hypothetical protein